MRSPWNRTGANKMFARRLKIALIVLDITGQTLASRMGVSRQAISLYRVARVNVTLAAAQKFSEATGLPINYWNEPDDQEAGRMLAEFRAARAPGKGEK